MCPARVTQPFSRVVKMATSATTVIGSPANFWLHSIETGYDLTHPLEPWSPLVQPRIRLSTTTEPVTLDPAKSALVIIDMQNFFLSPLLGRSRDGKGIEASAALVKDAIPACRKAGIRIIWLNWGLTQDEIDSMPPVTLKAFGFRRSSQTSAKGPSLYQGLGSQMGIIVSDEGVAIDAGRLLMRDQWNAALYDPLEESRQAGLGGKCEREDVWIHKNRMSGLWGSSTLCTEYLEQKGIKTLLFAGVNTDQCVGGSLQDAVTRGYDCLLLTDGCATTTPDRFGGQACVEYNVGRSWGFTLTCRDLATGVEQMGGV